MATPHVQLIVDHGMAPPQSLKTALYRVNARVSIRSLDKALTSGIPDSADVCVILPSAACSSAALERLVTETSARACATLVLDEDGASRDESTSARGGTTFSGEVSSPVTSTGRMLFAVQPFKRMPLNADELTGRIKALCEIRRPLRRMREEIAELRRDRPPRSAIHTDLDEQIRLAGQIQNDLLPEPIGDAAPLSISTLYLPADFVSGDTYDISRLDEDRFGFSLADATGHGLPAALLAILVKNSLRGKEIVDGSYRIIEPDELLTRLNQDLLAARLRQCHFITAMHAIFDRTTKLIRWARGGTPYPILFREGQRPRQIRSGGGLLGAFEDQAFEVAAHAFEPGDVLFFYTDGLEALLLQRNELRGEDAILATDWIERFRTYGPEVALDEARRLATEQPSHDWSRDDITAIAIRMTGG
ncbi:MAG TPA: PP2C family protein-serine/threonine phosphatase [Phycisphaerae bacterium]|nr:PP2C family protein-serine/threonine phosphatase [Phycisphaerae bacterium]HRY68441.1 PP2C family protein-serine/threonine phosphatase [Phycisphaerae bacterium]HSA28524.1 PP2C family protein-serine/threonine phosphatase [Phycisphaerae bacterium]